MKKEELSDAMSYIEDELLEQTNKVRSHPRGSGLTTRRYSNIVRWAAIAAAAALVVGIGYGTVNSLLFKNNGAKEATTAMYQDISNSNEGADINAMLSATKRAMAADITQEVAPQITVDGTNGAKEEADGGCVTGAIVADGAQAYEWVGRGIMDTYCKANVTVFRNKENLYVDGTWSLETLQDDEWVQLYNCPFTDNTVFTNPDLNNISSTDTSTTFEQVFDWSAYGALMSGTYRIYEMFYTFNGNTCENEYIPVEIEFGIIID